MLLTLGLAAGYLAYLAFLLLATGGWLLGTIAALCAALCAAQALIYATTTRPTPLTEFRIEPATETPGIKISCATCGADVLLLLHPQHTLLSRVQRLAEFHHANTCTPNPGR